MHYSYHHLMASAAYSTTLTYAQTNDFWACRARPLIISSKTKACQFSSLTHHI